MKQKNSNSKAIFNIETNKKTFYCAVTTLLFLSSLCFFIQQARAEKTDLSSFPVGNQQVITMATVNISDAKIIEQKDNIFQISFELANQTGVQPEVKYAVVLIGKTDKFQTKLDEKIYPEVVSLRENQTLSKEITYAAPTYLNGTFQLWLSAQNTSGLIFSRNSLGEIKLNGNSQFLEVGPTCYLKVEGQTGKKKYSIAQGVDIKNDEKLIATCQTTNHFNREITFTPGFKTYQRNTFGQLVKDNQESQATFSLKAQESKELSFALPKAQDPQAYDTVLTLLEGENAISNSIAFHYVLSGQSATIQSVILDKDYYTKGETAKLTFFWTPAADTFPNSRLGGTQSGILTAQINVTDKNGQACIDIFNKELTSQTIKEALDLSIVADCVNPQISATIKDASGQTLDQKIYSIESQNTPVITSQDPLKKYGLYGFVVLVILLVVVVLAIFLKRKNTIPLGLFFLIGLGIFFSGNVAKAASATYNITTNRYTVSLNKNVYDPGETMTVSVDAQYTGCSNSRQDPGDVYVTIKDNQKGFHSPNSRTDVGSWAVSKTWTANMTPGNYYATVASTTPVCNPSKMTCGKDNHQCCFDPAYFYLGQIPYTVRGQDCTPVNGILSGWNACSTSACGASGTQTRTCSGANSCGDTTCGGAALSQTCYGPSVVQGTLSGWNACSTSDCGASGTQTRTCNGASCGGNCNGEALSQTCTNAPCGCTPVNATLGGWDDCSATCGPGTQTRTCSGANSCGDTTCGGAALSQTCNLGDCPPDCTPIVNATLSAWNACFPACGDSTRTRTCSGAQCGGTPTCVGALWQDCSYVPCDGCTEPDNNCEIDTCTTDECWNGCELVNGTKDCGGCYIGCNTSIICPDQTCHDGCAWVPGTKDCSCTNTSWLPDPSTRCSGENFTQTGSPCGGTRPATGTKCCGSCDEPQLHCIGDPPYDDGCGHNICHGTMEPSYGPPSPCSKSCGGGTSTSHGTCTPNVTVTCNTKPCPPGYREVTPW